jgi:hypothetical protein
MPIIPGSITPIRDTSSFRRIRRLIPLFHSVIASGDVLRDAGCLGGS